MRGPIVEYNSVEFPNGIYHNGAIAFIDRDGVLNLGKSTYINEPDELEILEGAPFAIGELRRSGFRTCIVTNQSAIMRGLWDEHQLYKIHQRLQEIFLRHDKDAYFDIIITCPHRHQDNCKCRKPNPGMLNLANSIIRTKQVTPGISGQTILEVDSIYNPANWWKDKLSPIHSLDTMIGDRNSDMGAGWAVGARLFKVPEFIGISHVINRILDFSDPGDDFNPIR